MYNPEAENERKWLIKKYLFSIQRSGMENKFLGAN
jgi:hypothetical protein